MIAALSFSHVGGGEGKMDLRVGAALVKWGLAGSADSLILA